MEKSQERIRFENMYGRYVSNPWSRYKPDTVGHTISMIYVLTENYNIAERCTIGTEYVSYNGENIAKVLNENIGFTTFEFLPAILKERPHLNENVKQFKEGFTKYADHIEHIQNIFENFKIR